MDADKEETETININGNKVIDFINAIKLLGDILEKMNVIEVKEAFLMGKQINSVERILEIKKTWQSTLLTIATQMEQDLKSINECTNQNRIVLMTLKSFQSATSNPDFKEGIARVEKLIELCDRLEKHRASGILDAVSQFRMPK